ncbi:MAG: hypothetical protein NTW07_05350 [candidate division Zixibacteria bacterium]|nr:hypothetical protein [candidate division Zixibacteria bacterium]
MTTSFHNHARLGDIPGVYELLARSLSFCLEKYKALLPGYVFMPSHIHLLLIINGEQLADFMRDFKKYVSQKGIRDCGVVAPQVWQYRYDRVVVTSETIFRRKLEYMHRNPVKAGLCERDEQWVWSSASDYITDRSSPIPVWNNWNS